MSFTHPTGTRGAKQPGRSFRWMNRLMMGRARRTERKTMGMSLLVLTTVGRKSGQARQTPLAWFPGPDGGWLVVASATGAPANPAWYLNLAAHPDQVTVEQGGRKVAVTAEELHGAEREQAWRADHRRAANFRKYEDDHRPEAPRHPTDAALTGRNACWGDSARVTALGRQRSPSVPTGAAQRRGLRSAHEQPQHRARPPGEHEAPRTARPRALPRPAHPPEPAARHRPADRRWSGGGARRLLPHRRVDRSTDRRPAVGRPRRRRTGRRLAGRRRRGRDPRGDERPLPRRRHQRAERPDDDGRGAQRHHARASGTPPAPPRASRSRSR